MRVAALAVRRERPQRLAPAPRRRPEGRAGPSRRPRSRRRSRRCDCRSPAGRRPRPRRARCRAPRRARERRRGPRPAASPRPARAARRRGPAPRARARDDAPPQLGLDRERLALARAHEQQLQVGTLGRDRRERLDQDLEALASQQPARVHRHDAGRDAELRAQGRALLARGRPEARRVDAVRDESDARRDRRRPPASPADQARHRDEAVGVPQPEGS